MRLRLPPFPHATTALPPTADLSNKEICHGHFSPPSHAARAVVTFFLPYETKGASNQKLKKFLAAFRLLLERLFNRDLLGKGFMRTIVFVSIAPRKDGRKNHLGVQRRLDKNKFVLFYITLGNVTTKNAPQSKETAPLPRAESLHFPSTYGTAHCDKSADGGGEKTSFRCAKKAASPRSHPHTGCDSRSQAPPMPPHDKGNSRYQSVFFGGEGDGGSTFLVHTAVEAAAVSCLISCAGRLGKGCVHGYMLAPHAGRKGIKCWRKR